MKTSELIQYLNELKDKHGDLNVCISIPHEYWGSTESYVTKENTRLQNAQPLGPKSGKSENAIVITDY